MVKKKKSTFSEQKSKHVPEVWTILVRNIWGDNFGTFGPLTSLTLPCVQAFLCYHKINKRVISLVFVSFRQYCHTLYTNNIFYDFFNAFNIPIISISQVCWFYVILWLIIMFSECFWAYLELTVFSVSCQYTVISTRVPAKVGTRCGGMMGDDRALIQCCAPDVQR